MSPEERARRAVSAVFFVDGAALGGYVAHLADIQARLHLSNGQLGRSLLFSALGAVTTMPFAGPLIHRFGSRSVFSLSAVLLLIVLPFLMVAPSVVLICLTLYFVGVTNGQTDVGMNTHSMAVQDRVPRPILSAVHGWFSVGGFAGGFGAAAAARAGLSPLAHMVIASALLGGVLLAAYPALLPADVDRNAEGPRFAPPTRALVLLAILTPLSFVSEGAVWDWTSVYLRRSLEAPPWLGALGFSLASLAMAGGRFFGDAWTHRFGYRRTLLWSALLTGGGLVLAVTMPTPWLAVLGFAITGVGLANQVPILFRAAAQVPGVSAGAGLAAITTCGYAAFLGGPPLVGFVADLRGLAFALGLIAVACFLIALASRRATAQIEHK